MVLDEGTSVQVLVVKTKGELKRDTGSALMMLEITV